MSSSEVKVMVLALALELPVTAVWGACKAVVKRRAKLRATSRDHAHARTTAVQ